MACVVCLAGCSATSDAEVAAEPPAAESSGEGPGSASPASEPESQSSKSDDTLKFDPTQATGAVVGVPAPTNTTPIVAVANYYADLPGFDLSLLSTRQKEKFLQRVNSEMCTCGCKNDTLARCTVNDPSCPVVRGMVQRVFDEVRSGK
jgi:hypothetical protein